MLEALAGRTDKEASFHVEAFEKVVAMGLLGVYRKNIARHKFLSTWTSSSSTR